MPFKKTGVPAPIEKIYCGCGTEIVAGKCSKCTTEKIPKPLKTAKELKPQV